MRKLLVIFSFISLTVSANECVNEAANIAKMNLDQKAMAHSFQSSDVDPVPSSSSIKTTPEKLTTYKFIGYIYKGTYEASVTVDSACGVSSVKIKELL